MEEYRDQDHNILQMNETGSIVSNTDNDMSPQSSRRSLKEETLGLEMLNRVEQDNGSRISNHCERGD